jgi:hypothetical protein
VNPFNVLVLVVLGALVMMLPRRQAAMPLLIAALYTTEMHVLEIGPAHFTTMRILVLLGFIRIWVRSEGFAHGFQAADKAIAGWAATLMITGLFHDEGAMVFRSGMVWTEVGIYCLFRIFISNVEEVRSAMRFLCLAIVPLAGLMALESFTGNNLFAALGGVSETSISRAGNLRAGGPFDHPIFAGMVGACAVAWGLAFWRTSRLQSTIAVLAGVTIVFSAASSGPIMMTVFVLLGRLAWVLRRHMAMVRWVIALGIFLLDVVMHDPVYFLMARVDIAGGSQSYFRAALVQSALNHLPEWWLVGTDYTRHWMASGIHANATSTDITNHFLAMGVLGGFPLMLAFITVLVVSFGNVGRALHGGALSHADRALVWGLGALLFGFVMFFWSISIYVQTVALLYFTFACLQTAAGPGGSRSVPHSSVETAIA